VPAIFLNPLLDKAQTEYSRTNTVLVIEDDTDYSTLVRLRLLGDNHRFSVQSAETLAEGLARIALGGIDVVLIDLGLKDSQGIQTFRTLREKAPHLPTVILSGADQDKIALEAIQNGAQDYLVKSKIDGATLSRTLLYAIERQQITRALDSVTVDLRQANDRLERLAFLDPLTELLNRRGLQEMLTREIRSVRRNASPAPLVILLDLDDFKQVNDRLGHAIGDVVLQETARKLQACLRATDHLARIGGDEFMAVLPSTGREEVFRIAERMRQAICGSPISVTAETVIHITGSFGVITASPESPSIDELLTRLHSVLTKSKRDGKNRVSWDVAVEKSDDGHLDSLRGGACICAVKQPIFHLHEGYIIGYEYLSRCSLNGFEMPNDFFRCCAENNMLTLVDHHCLRQSIRTSAELPDRMQRHINMFPSTMVDIPAEHLLEAFDGYRSGKYCIEISEQQLMGDPSYLLPAVTALKNAGMMIAIDDVGFGRSCVESLVLLEPEIIKIDKRLILGIGESPAKRRALKRLLHVAEALVAEVIAEGIETQKDMDTLKELGVLYGQGYLLGRPG